MSGEILYGTCEICNKKAQLEPVTKYFPISCSCHSPQHFIRKDLCSDCAKNGIHTPNYVAIQFSANEMENPLLIARDIICRAMKEKTSDVSSYQLCIDTLDTIIQK